MPHPPRTACSLPCRKLIVRRNAGKPCLDLHVVFQGTVLDVGKTLADCEIGPQAVVDLVLPPDPDAQKPGPLEHAKTEPSKVPQGSSEALGLFHDLRSPGRMS